MTGIRQDTNEAYDTFLVTFSTVYDIFFPVIIKIKTEDLESPWTVKETKKVSSVCIRNKKKKEIKKLKKSIMIQKAF